MMMAFAGCKSDEQKYMDESFALHEEVFSILESNTANPDAAIEKLTKLEGDTREHREALRKNLKAALDELTDQERKAFQEKATKRYRELATKFATVLKEYPEETRPQIQALVSKITR